MPQSTRINIVRQALDDILERLSELPPSGKLQELKTKASSYDRLVRLWETRPPTEAERSVMLKSVLDLNVEVIAAGKEEA
jgi:hypothetical protein